MLKCRTGRRNIAPSKSSSHRRGAEWNGPASCDRTMRSSLPMSKICGTPMSTSTAIGRAPCPRFLPNWNGVASIRSAATGRGSTPRWKMRSARANGWPNGSQRRGHSPGPPRRIVDTICHIITKLELGGAQEVALYAVSHLDRRRFRPVLIAGPGGLLTEEARRLPGVQTVIVPSLGRRIHAVSDVFALVHLVMLLRRLKPAIVHTHSSKAGVLGRWAAWCARVPLIVHTVHGFGTVSYTHLTL